jgi:ribonucleotide reductase beta subunit family protein with ferritin-like domain
MDTKQNSKIMAIKDHDNMQSIKNLIDTMTIDDRKQLFDYLSSKTFRNIEDESKLDNTVIEPILDPNNKKFTAFPIQYQNIWKKYKEQMASFWKAEEIDFSNDYNDFMTLSPDEKHFIEMILAFFAASDGIVNFNLSERFMKEIQNTEILFTYQFQAMMENVHCVSADTKILTNMGYKKIRDILSENVKVWNGKEFSETTINYTGKSVLYRVELSNGMYLDCTPDHKWFINIGGQTNNKEIIFTKNLGIGDVVYDYELPVVNINDQDTFKNPYTHAVICGNKEKNKSYTNHQVPESLLNKPNYCVPINYSVKTKLEWFAGICDTIGTFKYNTDKTETTIQISSNNKKFLQNIQLMLTTLCTHSNITTEPFSSESSLSDENNEMIMDKHILTINQYNVKKLYDLKLNTQFEIFCTNVNNNDSINVTKITLLDGIHETYCFTEPKEHAGIFNGILTGQSETYSLMLDNIVKDKTKREFLFNAIKNVESVKMMAEWAFKWIESSKSFAHRVIAFAVVEGVFFSGAFAAIFWIKKYKNKQSGYSKGKPFMDGLIKSNKFISRDEGAHCNFACEIYSLLINKLSQNEINEIMKEGVEIAQKFMTDALPVKLIGMNHDSMCDYLEYIGDRLLVMLGHKKLYNKKNPFKFMETIGLNDKTNFFETRPHEYQDSHIMNKGNKTNIIINDDF